MTIRYVDHLLGGTTATYSIANRDDSGSDGPGYVTIQAAADVVNPGDVVYIRAGAYAMAGHTENVLSRSGTEEDPILFEGYQSEAVVIEGIFDTAWDLDVDPVDGNADGPPDTTDRSYLLLVAGDYVHVRKLGLTHAPYYGALVSGAHNLLEEITISHCWLAGVLVCGSFNTVRYVEAHHCRHQCGFGVGPDEGIVPTNNLIVRCLSYENGRDANGVRVLPIDGDPAGGGNSDGFASGKDCFDLFGGACITNTFRECLAWLNIDDGFDNSLTASLIVGNVALNNGPESAKGLKDLRRGSGNLYASNIAVGNDVGISPRALDTIDFFHNLTVLNAIRGQEVSVTGTESGRCHNNVSSQNHNGDTYNGATFSHDWFINAGDPELEEIDATFDLTLPAGSVQSRWQFVMDQIVAAFTPASGSPLINAGLFVPGYHCATADDDPITPMDPNAPGRHWMGAAPDIGPYEFGIVGNPDKTLTMEQSLPPNIMARIRGWRIS